MQFSFKKLINYQLIKIGRHYYLHYLTISGTVSPNVKKNHQPTNILTLNHRVIIAFNAACSLRLGSCFSAYLILPKASSACLFSRAPTTCRFPRRLKMEWLSSPNSAMIWQWTFGFIPFPRRWYLTASLWLCRWYYFFPCWYVFRCHLLWMMFSLLSLPRL